MASLISEGLRRIVGGDTQLATGDRAAVIVSVCAQKGGVGKTTTAVNLATALAMFHGQKVLLVDMDAQGHVAASLHNVLHHQRGANVSEILLGKRRDLIEVVAPTMVDDLYVTPSDKSLNDTESIIGSRIGKEFLLRQAMRVARTHFDVVVIDCPPNLGNLTLNALLVSQYALVPCDMSVLSLEGVQDLVDTIDTVTERLGHDLRLLGLLRTRVDSRTKTMNSAIDARLERDYRDVLFRTSIPGNTAIAKAQLDGRPVFRFDAASKGAQAYRALADEVALRLALPGRTRVS